VIHSGSGHHYLVAHVAMSFFNRLFRERKPKDPAGLQAVPGAASFSHGDEVVYNILTPHMQQFLGRCIGALKKEGITAKGTGQFSIVLGDAGTEELHLQHFYRPDDDPALIQAVVSEGRKVSSE